MHKRILLILIPLLQTSLCTAKDPKRPLPDTFLPVTLSDTASANTGYEAKLESLPRRGLLAKKTCTWNDDASTCASSPSVEAGILRKSKNEFAKLWMHIKECSASGTTEEKCAALEECGWNRRSETCEFVDFLGQYPDSPCVENSPLTFSYTQLFLQCPSQATIRACREFEGCSWDRVHDLCYADLYHIYFGVESRDAFTTEFLKVDQRKLATGLAEVAPTVEKSNKKTDWKSLLKVKVPKSDCPDGTEQLICDYVDAHLPHMFPEHAYCFFRYSEEEEKTCNADKLCRHNAFQGCTHRHEIMIDSLEKADEVLLDLIEDETDNHLAREFLRCDRIAKAADCKGNCQWTRNTCAIRRAYMDEEFLQDAKKDSKDPVCQYFRMQLDSGCLDIDTEKKCSSAKGCEWKTAHQECDVSSDTIREALIEEDPKLKKPLTEAAETCQPQNNAKACSKA